MKFLVIMLGKELYSSIFLKICFFGETFFLRRVAGVKLPPNSILKDIEIRPLCVHLEGLVPWTLSYKFYKRAFYDFMVSLGRFKVLQGAKWA